MDQPTPGSEPETHNPLDGFTYIGGSFAVRPDPSGNKDGYIAAAAHVFFDWDSYRWLDVLHEREDEIDWDAEDDEHVKWFAGTTRLLRALVDDLPPDVLAIDMDAAGKICWTSTDAEYNAAACTYYPSVDEYQLPPSARNLRTLLRTDLTVIDRLGAGTDKVSYICPDSGQEKTVAYKANAANSHYGGVWEEIQIMARLPPHPLILALDSLVLEELTELGVVGFTTPVVHAPTLDKIFPKPFKLRWLRELMGLVDELNLAFGVMHQDIAPRNLFINPDTDSILLFDFNYAAGIGQTQRNGRKTEKPGRDDVKGVMYFMYLIITRDPEYFIRQLDLVKEEDLEDRDKWIKHPQVELDDTVSAFYDELMAWVRTRRGRPPLTHYTQAPRHIEVPMPPEPPRDELEGGGANLADLATLRILRLEAGRPVLTWQRPPRAKVDKSRRLLATGQYADERIETAPIPVPDSKRGFPQPPARLTRARLRRHVRNCRGGNDRDAPPTRGPKRGREV
jgi:hypothetical protein